MMKVDEFLWCVLVRVHLHTLGFFGIVTTHDLIHHSKVLLALQTSFQLSNFLSQCLILCIQLHIRVRKNNIHIHTSIMCKMLGHTQIRNLHK